MRFSLRFLLVSVGVLIAFGNATSIAAPVPAPAQKPPKSDSSNSATVPSTLPANGLLQSIRDIERQLDGATDIRTAQNTPAPNQGGNSPTTPLPPSSGNAQPTNSASPSNSLPPYPEINTQAIGQPIGPAKQGAAPEYLNPVPNPLLVPTRADQVRLRGVQPITLQQALDLAERNNLTYRNFQFRLSSSLAQLRAAQSSLYPTLSLQSTFAQSGSIGTVTTGFGAPTTTLNQTFNASLGLNYQLFTFGRREALIRASEQQFRQDQLQLEITREQLRLDVTNAYYDLQSADSNVQIQQAAVRNAEASLRDTLALERAGIGTRFDVLQAQGQLANFQIQLTTAQGQQRVSRRRLAQLLDVPPTIDLASGEPVAIAGTWTMSLEDSIILAFQNRAELPQAIAAREQAIQQRRAALAQLYPTLSLNAQYQVVNDFLAVTGPNNSYQLAAVINWNIFNGFQAQAQAAQAEAGIGLAETAFATARNQIRNDVETAYINLQTNQTNVATSRISVENAQAQLRLARLRFQAGVGTQTDVINAENQLTASQGNLITAILNYNRALASLQRAITNLPIPTGQRTPPLSPGPAHTDSSKPATSSAKPPAPAKGAAALK